MKISYERLNQIIEEEVVRFKKLNEETQLSQDPEMIAFNAEVSRIAGLATTKEAAIKFTGLLRGIK